ncbi:hypothetical protein [Deinococcus yavapaiensis]|nr:hypothetical protein [Deinococcus yavapaiensis]
MTVVFLVQRDGEPERVTHDIEEAAQAMRQGNRVTFRVPGNGTLSNARTILTPAWVTSLRDLTRRSPAFVATADAV